MRAWGLAGWVAVVAILAVVSVGRSQPVELPESGASPRARPPLTKQEQAELAKEAFELNQAVVTLYRQGRLAEAVQKAERALAMLQKLYPKERYPDGHPNLAASLNNLGTLMQARVDYGKALGYLEWALAMRQKLYPKERFPGGHPNLARSLSNLGTLLHHRGDDGGALDYYGQALAMWQKLYPDGHPELATSLTNLGSLMRFRGDYSRALGYHERALAMRQKLYPKERFPDGHHHLAHSLNGLGSLMLYRGDYSRALGYHERALTMRQKLYPKERYPDGHPELAVSLTNLGTLMRFRRNYGRALDYYERALAMFEKLYASERYPNGHPQLATSLFNLGELLRARGNYGEALGYYERALAMRQMLYPEGHYPTGHLDLATSLFGLGALLYGRADYAGALTYYERALAMFQKLYPKERYRDGHPDLASSLNSLGILMLARGDYGRALDFHEQALAMFQKLYSEKRYPNGHPDLAVCLSNLGAVLHVCGDYGRALAYNERALAMQHRLGNSFIFSSAEAEALEFLNSLPRIRDGYLSVVAKGKASSSAVYARVWQSRALLTRLLQRRHQATRIALVGSDVAGRKWQELLDTRRHLARLLLDPCKEFINRTKELVRLTDRKEALERDLAALLPEIERNKELDSLGPSDLAGLLPEGSVFVDLLRYTHFGKDLQHTDKYLAFVVRPDKSVRQVELGEAGPTDDAVRAWRAVIAGGKDTPADAARVAKRVWEPVARELPSGTSTVYLAPDGELARLPWAALPGKKPGTVLLGGPGRGRRAARALPPGAAQVPAARCQGARDGAGPGRRGLRTGQEGRLRPSARHCRRGQTGSQPGRQAPGSRVDKRSSHLGPPQGGAAAGALRAPGHARLLR
jgi:tetratricopeptide (TPR) repeat protein